MDGAEILILSGSDSSEFEVYSVSSDEETEIRPRAGNPSDCHGGSSNKNRIERSSKSTQNVVATKDLSEVTQAASKSAFKMTCQVKQRTSLPAESLKNRHMYKNKTWSQVRKEKEDRRCVPPANKKARLNLPEVSCSSKLTRPIHISDEEDEFSDELPDLDQRQKTPERQPVRLIKRVESSPISLSSDDDQKSKFKNNVSKKPQSASSPIRLSSDEDPSPSRLGLFESLNMSNSNVSVSSSVSNSSANKEKQPAVNKLLLTKTTKEKMASVIGNFLRQKSTNDSESRPHSPSAFSDISSCSSKRSNGNRHFLDVIREASETRSESPVPSLSDVSESTHIDLEQSDNESYDSDSDEEDEDYRPENDSRYSDTESAVEKVGSDLDVSTPKKPRLGNVKKRPPGPIPVGIKKYFEPNPKETFKVVPLKERPRHLLSYQNKYSCESDDLAVALTHLHVNTIDAAFEEGGKFVEDGLSLVSDFSSRLKPTEGIVKEIIGKSLLGNSRLSVCFNAFKILSSIWQKYPSCIYINWDDFARVVGNLSLERGMCAAPTESGVRGSLYLQLVVQALETDLYQRNLHNLVQIRRAAAYKYLSVDTAYANLKEIVYWIGSIVTAEYKNVSNNRLARNVNEDQARDSWSQIGAGYVSKVLPNLQKLLQLGIQVSRNCVDAAKRVSGELVRTYIYLADIRQKKLLLQSLSSDLLKFKVSQKILEEYCDGTSLCCEDFPVSLRQVVEAYYLASPPRSLVTPPQSPSDDEALGAPALGSQQYSASSCEELAMLIYINTQSYLQCAQTTEYEPLAQQLGTMQKKHYSFVSERDLTQLQDAVNELHSHMLQLTSELNGATHTYLFMMHCLSRLR